MKALIYVLVVYVMLFLLIVFTLSGCASTTNTPRSYYSQCMDKYSFEFEDTMSAMMYCTDMEEMMLWVMTSQDISLRP